jgi:hypothetical protein
VSGVRIKIVVKSETKIKCVVVRATSIINLVKLVAIISIGVAWVVVIYGGNNIRILA